MLLTVGDDQCAVPGEERYDCGFPGITAEECVLGRSCCWNTTVHNVNWCFFPQPSQYHATFYNYYLPSTKQSIHVGRSI